MINLKLAEYDKEGKFERFLEMASYDGKLDFPKFVLGEDFIFLTLDTGVYRTQIEGAAWLGGFKKDEKDPLNRFDGLFDGRTYGDGRFVLIRGEEGKFEDYIIDDGQGVHWSIDTKLLVYKNGLKGSCGSVEEECDVCEIFGNLHENPELYEKYKIYEKII